ncbi:MAG: methionine synthase (B12-independent) [Acidimicrobiaceae bacterium]|nr:methionine synthase (B12-independent) [Acidimicrobiaceae bacterium]
MAQTSRRIPATNLGFPRIGARRELKRALEGYWSDRIEADELLGETKRLRLAHWQLQRDLGLDHVPSNDFSLYDHVLDTAVLVGAVPDRFAGASQIAGAVGLDAYFAMARGGEVGGRSVPALEMTKWFDTNYHYIVPEMAAGQRFALGPNKPLAEFVEALEAGIHTRPVLLGPVSFLVLALRGETTSSLERLLPGLLGVYEEVLASLAAAGAEWVQIDEPALALDLDDEIREAYQPVYRRLADSVDGLKVLVATYFSGLRSNLPVALALPVAALHLDLVAEPDQLEPALDGAPESLALSLGVVDGRNVWRTDLDEVLGSLEGARSRLGADRVLVGPSCSLLHLPVDVSTEMHLDAELRSWMAFARQRLEELGLLARALEWGPGAVEEQLGAARHARELRKSSTRVVDPEVRARTAVRDAAQERRSSPYELRRQVQQDRLGLPLLPTTTIGSFPQTPALRSLRARYRRGEIGVGEYEGELRSLVAAAVAMQEEIGLDVLVHGEFERTDMVEYFAENLSGYAVTEGGWVQSYGSRCVKPPVIFGDIRRPGPLTVAWTAFAQSLTSRPVKGMLTGPLTLLSWSFVRDDQPLEETARQLALAVRDEVGDLEAAGAAIVQVDEPGLREGLPLHVADRAEYLRWAVAAFRLATGGAAPGTQIHTHMCYAEFGDVLDAIVAFDADVISLESSRSSMEPLRSFGGARYPNGIGPGVFDIHSARVPDVTEMADHLRKALAVLEPFQLWVNPDCGLKTRRWEEVDPALRHMVEAARAVRITLGA